MTRYVRLYQVPRNRRLISGIAQTKLEGKVSVVIVNVALVLPPERPGYRDDVVWVYTC